MNVKILGTGCPACQSMYNTVNQIVAREKMNVEVEYVQDIQRILSYGVMSIPVLVVNEKVVMIGNRGATKIEQALRAGSAA
jgi:small redox-active disulfide protein 2